MRISALILTCLPGFVYGQDALPTGTTISEPVTYHVSMKTSLVIPNRGVRSLRVWQAIPDRRPWSGAGSDIGAVVTGVAPSFGYVDHNAPHNADHMFWQLPSPGVG